MAEGLRSRTSKTLEVDVKETDTGLLVKPSGAAETEYYRYADRLLR